MPAHNGPSPKPAKKIRRVVQRLKYYSGREKAWLRHETIRLHQAAVSIQELEPEEFRVLKRSISPKNGPAHLNTPIVVTKDGLIVDGRHRARALVESGHGDELAAQIRARRGDWVEQLPEGEDPYLYAAKIQRGRRSCAAWRIAWGVLPGYEKAVEAGNLLRGRHGRKKGSKSPVTIFCETINITKAVFSQIARVRRSAHPDDIAALDAGKVSLNSIVKKLDAEEKANREASSPEKSRIDDSTAGTKRTRVSSNAAPGVRKTGTDADGKRGSVDADRDRAVKLVNRLLTPEAGETAAATAEELIESLDDGPRQLMIDAALAMAGQQRA